MLVLNWRIGEVREMLVDDAFEDWYCRIGRGWASDCQINV